MRREDLSPGWTGEAGWCRLLCPRPENLVFVISKQQRPLSRFIIPLFVSTLNKSLIKSREHGGKALLANVELESW